jgi:invasion protein IalB
MKLSSIMLVTGALAFSATGTAWAQTSGQSTAAPAPQAKKGRDPNEIVCQKIEVLGSRLATKRVCQTRAEWAEQQRQDRMDTERAQTQRPCGQASGC